MKKLPALVFGLLLTIGWVSVSAQKKVGEIMIVYNYSLSSPGNSGFNAVHTLFIKSHMSRSEIQSPVFSSVVIHDSKLGDAVILKEVSGQKLLIRMSASDWQDRNKRYKGIVFKNTGETKTIAGYVCNKATATTADGLNISVYYTRDITVENKDYDPLFQNLDGLPLEYQMSNSTMEIKYSLASINLNPVPASKFDIPKSGYREMTYEESKKLNVGG
jgi:GLPGLI family protein